MRVDCVRGAGTSPLFCRRDHFIKPKLAELQRPSRAHSRDCNFFPDKFFPPIESKIWRTSLGEHGGSHWRRGGVGVRIKVFILGHPPPYFLSILCLIWWILSCNWLFMTSSCLYLISRLPVDQHRIRKYYHSFSFISIYRPRLIINVRILDLNCPVWFFNHYSQWLVWH